MTCTSEEIVKIAKVFHEFELASEIFLSQASFAPKHKRSGAQRLTKAIDEYKKLPAEIRSAFESDKSTNASKLIELETLCKETLN
jgi:hypothetical protein